MSAIVPRLGFFVKQRLLKALHGCRSAAVRVRYLIVLTAGHGRGAFETAAVPGVHNATVYRVARRFRERGEWGLLEGRADNGAATLDVHVLDVLYRLVRSSPQEHGWRRPKWPRELLAKSLRRGTGVHGHVATMSRVRALIVARRGRPRPTVRCPWPPAAKGRRLAAIRRQPPPDHVAVYEDGWTST